MAKPSVVDSSTKRNRAKVEARPGCRFHRAAAPEHRARQASTRRRARPGASTRSRALVRAAAAAATRLPKNMARGMLLRGWCARKSASWKEFDRMTLKMTRMARSPSWISPELAGPARAAVTRRILAEASVTFPVGAAYILPGKRKEAQIARSEAEHRP